MLRNSSLALCLIVSFLINGRTLAQNSTDTGADNPSVAEQVEAKAGAELKPRFRNELIRGQVVWLADALQNHFGISTVPEVAENSLAILTKDGQLVPIVENLRGRAFRKDERLRGKETEILARRYDKQPLVQVLRVYQFDDQKRYEIDYWCDVCAIVMFETGPCSCCQDDNRLRKRLVENDEVQTLDQPELASP